MLPQYTFIGGLQNLKNNSEILELCLEVLGGCQNSSRSSCSGKGNIIDKISIAYIQSVDNITTTAAAATAAAATAAAATAAAPAATAHAVAGSDWIYYDH